METRFRQTLGLILLLLSPVCIIGGLWRQWWELSSRSVRTPGPGGTFSISFPSFAVVPHWPLWIAGLGVLVGLCGLILLAVRSSSRGE